MFIKEVMSRCVMECTEDMRLEEVYELIKKCEHGIVIVLDSYAHRVPIGVVSERSICEQIIARGRNPRGLFAGLVMDSHIKKVCEDDLIESIEVDETTPASVIVVTDGNRQVSGVLALKDLRSSGRAMTRIPAAVPAREIARATTAAVSEIPAFGWVQ